MKIKISSLQQVNIETGTVGALYFLLESSIMIRNFMFFMLRKEISLFEDGTRMLRIEDSAVHLRTAADFPVKGFYLILDLLVVSAQRFERLLIS